MGMDRGACGDGSARLCGQSSEDAEMKFTMCGTDPLTKSNPNIFTVDWDYTWEDWGSKWVKAEWGTCGSMDTLPSGS